MFIGCYELEGKENFSIYYGSNGWSLFNGETFSPECKNINILNFVIFGKNYKEKKEFLKDLAIKWQYDFSNLYWSYGELAEIQNYFYKNGKKYGLLKEFKENAII